MSEETSYSQYGEDLIVAKIFGPKITGRLLEIGAWHPTIFSNSRLLIEKGWDAVLVDFSPLPIHKLVQEYGRHSHVKILQAAISVADHGNLCSFEITDDGLSSNTQKVLEHWKDKGGYFGRLWVPQLSLERLLFQFGANYAFVSIDTEGTSVDLAIHYLIALGQLPQVMCIEHDNRIVELMTAAQERGYSLIHANGTNVIIAREFPGRMEQV